MLLNYALLRIPANHVETSTAQGDSSTSTTKLTIVNIRDIGRKEGKDKNDIVKIEDLSVLSVNDLLSRKTPISQDKINQKKAKLLQRERTKFKTSRQDTIAGVESDLLLNTGIEFESKKGTPIDELNSHELVYYSFRNRSAIQYKNAIVKNMNILKQSNPRLFLRIKDTIHNMKGKISYDREGNVMNIRVLQWSDSDEIQDFFVQALRDIRAIRNPPQGILDDRGFRATYELKLVL